MQEHDIVFASLLSGKGERTGFGSCLSACFRWEENCSGVWYVRQLLKPEKNLFDGWSSTITHLPYKKRNDQ
jgi:hypothetical protein